MLHLVESKRGRQITPLFWHCGKPCTVLKAEIMMYTVYLDKVGQIAWLYLLIYTRVQHMDLQVCYSQNSFDVHCQEKCLSTLRICSLSFSHLTHNIRLHLMHM